MKPIDKIKKGNSFVVMFLQLQVFMLDKFTLILPHQLHIHCQNFIGWMQHVMIKLLVDFVMGQTIFHYQVLLLLLYVLAQMMAFGLL